MHKIILCLIEKDKAHLAKEFVEAACKTNSSIDYHYPIAVKKEPHTYKNDFTGRTMTAPHTLVDAKELQSYSITELTETIAWFQKRRKKLEQKDIKFWAEKLQGKDRLERQLACHALGRLSDLVFNVNSYVVALSDLTGDGEIVVEPIEVIDTGKKFLKEYANYVVVPVGIHE